MQQNVVIQEGVDAIVVKAKAPIPTEISNQSQALALAREAAITTGQTHLLSYILSKRTRSGKELSEAEIPSLKLQDKVRGTVSGAQILSTRYDDGQCQVTMSVSKSRVKVLRKGN
jgi:hypothetical protein